MVLVFPGKVEQPWRELSEIKDESVWPPKQFRDGQTWTNPPLNPDPVPLFCISRVCHRFIDHYRPYQERGEGGRNGRGEAPERETGTCC